jgi:hypothetical protein
MPAALSEDRAAAILGRTGSNRSVMDAAGNDGGFEIRKVSGS